MTDSALHGASSPSLVLLVGNPNTGKTSLFNALTGYRGHVANYPGATVELASGRLAGVSTPIDLVDLPGTYSLTPTSPDEELTQQVCTTGVPGRGRAGALLAIVDASNMPRNLYLVSQLRELGTPMILALNMVDVAQRRQLGINVPLLSQRLGVPVVPVIAVQEHTLPALRAAIEHVVCSARGTTPEREPTGSTMAGALPLVGSTGRLPTVPINVAHVATHTAMPPGLPLPIRGQRSEPRAALPALVPPEELNPAISAAAHRGDAADFGAEIRARYQWVAEILYGVITRPASPNARFTERLDAVLLHRWAGPPLLVGLLLLVFQAIFSWAGPLMDAISGLFEALSGALGPLAPEGLARSLLVDGLIGGVSGVLVFMPQILILYFFIAVLEDSGYMARAAFMSDRLMRVFGLSGRALIPLLSGYACAIPAILGARTIRDWRERLITILIIPFMSCSARLPVYVLLIAAIVPPTAWLGGWITLPALVLLGMYLIGALVALPVAWTLQRVLPQRGGSTFLMELPPYQVPRWRAVLQRMLAAGRDFLVRAGTVILLLNMIVWALGYFPRSAAVAERVAVQSAAAGWDDAQRDAEISAAYLRESYLGRLGHTIEPALRPLGWDWRIGVAVLASFPAREVIVATLGTLHGLSGTVDENSAPLQERLRALRWPADTPVSGAIRPGAPIITLPVALSIMVFFALCAQCSSTLVTMGRELRSWRWPVLSFVGMTTLAYAAAWVVGAAARGLGL